MTPPSETHSFVFSIRLYQSGDEPSLASICCRTGDSGQDATGILSNDSIWGAIWVLPYVKRNPELARVLETDGNVIGYVVATPDTADFNTWFRQTWWPTQRDRFPITERTSAREKSILSIANAKGTIPISSPYHEDYPAHLHINLLPAARGAGVGRRMMHTILRELSARGVKGVQLGTSAANTAACAFYQKVGFTEVPEKAGSRRFVWDLSHVPE